MYKGIVVILLLVSFKSFGQTPLSNEIKVTPSKDITHFADAISVSGNRILVGATQAGNLNGSGAAYVFEFNGSSWVETQRLTAMDEDFGDNFGGAVSLLGDRAAISAIKENNSKGAVYIFEYNGSTWSETAKITADDSQDDDKFGSSISLSKSGVLIGAPEHDRSSNPLDSNIGAAYLYDASSNWQQFVKFTAASDVGAGFGASVDLSDETAVVGAFNDGILSGNPGGSAYVYQFNGTSWAQTSKLLPSDEETVSGFFGGAVSLSGNRIAVADRISENVYIFEKQNNLWSETALISQSGNGFFGQSISLSGDKLLIGEPANNSNKGQAFLYEKNGQNWTQSQIFSASDGLDGDQFGFALDFDGSKAIIGVPSGDAVQNGRTSAAYIYSSPDAVFKNGFETPTK